MCKLVFVGRRIRRDYASFGIKEFVCLFGFYIPCILLLMNLFVSQEINRPVYIKTLQKSVKRYFSRSPVRAGAIIDVFRMPEAG